MRHILVWIFLFPAQLKAARLQFESAKRNYSQWIDWLTEKPCLLNMGIELWIWIMNLLVWLHTFDTLTIVCAEHTCFAQTNCMLNVCNRTNKFIIQSPYLKAVYVVKSYVFFFIIYLSLININQMFMRITIFHHHMSWVTTIKLL